MDLEVFLTRFQAQQFLKVRAHLHYILVLKLAQTFWVKRGSFWLPLSLLLCPAITNSRIFHCGTGTAEMQKHPNAQRVEMQERPQSREMLLCNVCSWLAAVPVHPQVVFNSFTTALNQMRSCWHMPDLLACFFHIYTA